MMTGEKKNQIQNSWLLWIGMVLIFVMLTGCGGQQIVLVDNLDMVIVVLVDPLHMQWGDEPWRIKKSNLNLVADFIASLPKG